MTFLYDIGRVLLDFDFESSLRRLLPPGTPEPEVVLQRLLERKDELESGLIAEDEFVAWALDLIGNGVGASAFRDAWQQIFSPIEPMWDCVGSLASAGHRLLLFSNISSLHVPWVYEAFPRFSVFHGAVLSFEAGCMKPEPRIYQIAMETHALDPETTVYIDDLGENIATGRQFGFQCWQYDLNNHRAFEHWLRSFAL